MLLTYFSQTIASFSNMFTSHIESEKDVVSVAKAYSEIMPFATKIIETIHDHNDSDSATYRGMDIDGTPGIGIDVDNGNLNLSVQSIYREQTGAGDRNGYIMYNTKIGKPIFPQNASDTFASRVEKEVTEKLVSSGSDIESFQCLNKNCDRAFLSLTSAFHSGKSFTSYMYDETDAMKQNLLREKINQKIASQKKDT